jgi:arylformamidase
MEGGIGLMIYDVSMTLEPGMLVFEGDPPYEVTHPLQIAKGDLCNLSVLCFGSHTGTHIDAPRHFIEGGASVDELPLEHFFGPARLLEFPGAEWITAGDLEENGLGEEKILLLKTRNSALLEKSVFDRTFTGISEDAARYLASAGIRTVGIDYLSIEGYGSQAYPVHQLLLGNGIVILEGLRLAGVPPGRYQLAALPIKIREGNGSPVRAILIAED